MRIYLDNCSLQRPFDDRSQQRVRVEQKQPLPWSSWSRRAMRYFSTADDRLLKQARRLELGGVEAVSLLHRIEEVGHGSGG